MKTVREQIRPDWVNVSVSRNVYGEARVAISSSLTLHMHEFGFSIEDERPYRFTGQIRLVIGNHFIDENS